MLTAPDDPLFLQGVEYFNRRAYFSSHEVWEELWNDTAGPQRDFYKGLIQAAVALHHLLRGNREGAEKLFLSSQGLLAAFVPRHQGVEIEELLTSMKACFDSCRRTSPGGGRATIDSNLLPFLRISHPPKE